MGIFITKIMFESESWVDSIDLIHDLKVVDMKEHDNECRVEINQNAELGMIQYVSVLNVVGESSAGVTLIRWRVI